MKDLLIPYGHRTKVIKKIKDLKNEDTNKKITKNVHLKKEEKPKSNFQYDELPDESEIQDSIMNISHHSKISDKKDNSIQKNSIDLNNKNNIPNFEENQKRLFHQAVIDFVNENRPKYDKDGERIFFLKEEFGHEIKNTILHVNINKYFNSFS